MRRRRTLLLAALALTVPLPAFALTGEEAAGPVSFPVTATLDGCGLGDAQVICRVSVAFNDVEGATSYTATVTGPDGSVVDAGEVASGQSIYVPYVGPGHYAVNVNAYGPPPEEESSDPEPIATGVAAELERRDGPGRDRVEATSEATERETEPAAESSPTPSGEAEADACEDEAVPGEELEQELAPEDAAAQAAAASRASAEVQAAPAAPEAALEAEQLAAEAEAATEVEVGEPSEDCPAP